MADGDPTALRSVGIAVAILDCFADAPELGPTAVAQRLGIAKSTASRMLAVLAQGGILERREGGRYRLGLRLFEYGQLALSRLRLAEVSVPVLADLRDRLRELVQLGVAIGGEVLFLDRHEVESVDRRFHGPTWRRVPLHSSSCGRAIAAFNPAVAQAMLDRPLTRLTRYTLVDGGRLRAVLAETRRRGYALTHEEAEEGMSSVAAPILVERGGRRLAIAGVSVVGPSRRFSDARARSIATHVRAAAAEIAAVVEVRAG